MFIDTHTHLYVDAFEEDRKEVVQRAIDNGIELMLLPNIDVATIDDMHMLTKQFPNNCRSMMGLHPGNVKEDWEAQLNTMKDLLFKSDQYIAVGEIGMDLYWDKKFLKEQQLAFSQQIKLAKEHKLPIVIHCREAFDEVFEVLEQHSGDDLYGIFHCFTGTLSEAKRAIDLNFKLGIGGVVTFKNGRIDQFLNKIPMESIVLETDAPYLSPTPHRGNRNESSYIHLIMKKVAECYAVSDDIIAKITTENALSVFKNQKIKF